MPDNAKKPIPPLRTSRSSDPVVLPNTPPPKPSRAIHNGDYQAPHGCAVSYQESAACSGSSSKISCFNKRDSQNYEGNGYATIGCEGDEYATICKDKDQLEHGVQTEKKSLYTNSTSGINSGSDNTSQSGNSVLIESLCPNDNGQQSGIGSSSDEQENLTAPILTPSVSSHVSGPSLRNHQESGSDTTSILLGKCDVKSLQLNREGSGGKPTPILSNGDGDKPLQSSVVGGCLEDGNLTPKTNPKTNRKWKKILYPLKEKKFVVPFSFIYSLYGSAALVYFDNPELFKAFLLKNVVNPGIIADYKIIWVISAILIPVICMFLLSALYRIRYIEEHKIINNDYDNAIKEVFQYHKIDTTKAIRSMFLKYTNNTIVELHFNIHKKDEGGGANADAWFIHKTNKLNLLVNNRPMFTVLLISFIMTNTVLNLGLYITGNNLGMFYKNILSSNINISHGTVLLLIVNLSGLVYLGFHYWDKMGCCSRIYVEDSTYIDNAKKINEFIGEKMLKGDVGQSLAESALAQVHRQIGKQCSLTLKQVVVTSHNSDIEAVYNMG
ncbi:hypothetical protein BIY23_00940 [Wolbachia pipientis]|uniref:Uncharacterized protein n=1 Tax=Wolbachia pipientis TaxID=955 RepID=A0A1E7QKN4_WOLPI|nr:hypothetical protein [Wolbachia pipientis]OEY87040.1 hypothetical protein BIY23_00940 [Wolbachia pipientis]